MSCSMLSSHARAICSADLSLLARSFPNASSKGARVLELKGRFSILTTACFATASAIFRRHLAKCFLLAGIGTSTQTLLPGGSLREPTPTSSGR